MVFHRLHVALLVVSLASCSHQPPPKRYELQGRVVAVDPATNTLTIDQKDIPGYMDAMIMPYVVGEKDKWVFKSIAPGDEVHATLVVGVRAELEDIGFTRSSNAPPSSTSTLHVPQPGDQVPDFTLVNQNGKTIHFRQFRGKPLLVTFMYTRCPFPDYCPRMSSNFAQILQQLQKDPKVAGQAQLLSISIDPEHDKPAALRSYGEHYADRLDPKFVHWEFASGSAEQVREAADFFGLSYNQKDGQIVHGLVTVLIGKDGQVAKVYSGNDWKPEEVAKDFEAATSG